MAGSFTGFCINLLSVAGSRVALSAAERATLEKAIAKATAEATTSAKQNNYQYRDGSAILYPKEIMTSSGITIRANPDKTTTVIGSFGKDTDRIINNELGLPTSMLLDESVQPGHINLLNVPKSYYKGMTQSEFCEQVNKPWLDSAIKRGDDIVLATKPTDLNLNTYRADGTKIRSGFGMEYDSLKSRGYTYDVTSSSMKNRPNP